MNKPKITNSKIEKLGSNNINMQLENGEQKVIASWDWKRGQILCFFEISLVPVYLIQRHT